MGIALGFYWHEKSAPSGEDILPPADLEDLPASFGEYFKIFFLGRTGNGTRIKKDSPLVPAKKFLEGERVGLRTQTLSTVKSPVRIELRFLDAGTREETAALRKSRQTLKIAPGTVSTCCVVMPKAAGTVDIGIVIEDVFVGYLDGIEIKKPQEINQGWSLL